MSNLNAGTGNPCAGHDKLIALSSFLMNKLSLVSDENFGFDPPIGSTIHKMSRIVNKSNTLN